ncbi:MAG: hypothetical protein IIC03_06695 [Proteobacteria bacterium]|nr:hypothetical protein [Pseudomonadota bacterium]
MKIRLTGAMAALAATLMVAPAAMAHGNFGPAGGQDRGAAIGQGGMMGQGYGEHGKTGYRYGHGGMMGSGQGYGQGGMMGRGMMGQGQGYGQRGMMGMAAPLAEDLSIDGVRHIMEHRVAMMQNPNLKVGEIVDQDDDTITADVVTQDGSLVRRFMVDRHTGAMRPAGVDNVEK